MYQPQVHNRKDMKQVHYHYIDLKHHNNYDRYNAFILRMRRFCNADVVEQVRKS